MEALHTSRPDGNPNPNQFASPALNLHYQRILFFEACESILGKYHTLHSIIVLGMLASLITFRILCNFWPISGATVPLAAWLKDQSDTTVHETTIGDCKYGRKMV
jgi:hypothetical protein